MLYDIVINRLHRSLTLLPDASYWGLDNFSLLPRLKVSSFSDSDLNIWTSFIAACSYESMYYNKYILTCIVLIVFKLYMFKHY